METFWFIALAWVLATYVVMDGFDLGAGLLHLWIARTDAERRQVMRSLGPVWDGNEVWLLAAGGTMFLAFPRLLATAFSGFYLPLMLVLWLLLFRGLGIELREQIEDRMWTAIWDAAFGVASLLLVVCLGAALGNVFQGVTFNGNGSFFAPLWSDGTANGARGIVDWFPLLVAAQASVSLGMHGALWLAWRTDEHVQARAERLASKLAWVVLAGAAVCTVMAFRIQPRLAETVSARPWGLLAPLGAAAVVAVPQLVHRRRHRAAFLCSALHLYSMVAACAVGMYPRLLSGADDATSLTIDNSAAAAYGLAAGIWWWLPGMVTVLAGQAFVYGQLPRVVSVHDAD